MSNFSPFLLTLRPFDLKCAFAARIDRKIFPAGLALRPATDVIMRKIPPQGQGRPLPGAPSTPLREKLVLLSDVWLPQFGEQRLRLLQILGVEAFGEPTVNRGEQLIRVLAFALALPQPCQAGRRPQLPHFRLLAARPVE